MQYTDSYGTHTIRTLSLSLTVQYGKDLCCIDRPSWLCIWLYGAFYEHSVPKTEMLAIWLSLTKQPMKTSATTTTMVMTHRYEPFGPQISVFGSLFCFLHLTNYFYHLQVLSNNMTTTTDVLYLHPLAEDHLSFGCRRLQKGYLMKTQDADD